MKSKEKLISFLEEHNILHSEITVPRGKFPPQKDFWQKNNILRCKNLFFRDNHGKNHFLVVFDYYKKIDIKNLQNLVGRGSLSFASGWRLDKYLGLKPGYISVFGILNDSENHVKVILDRELDQDTLLSFLPNTEGGSFFALSFPELRKFLELSGNEFSIEAL